ncbi:MAG: hypothetical protein IBX50_17615 [Marinospirillum sp.]|uniref:hypothetical protein n=1 Tax=Marinospirillum sp. TaxID=2183934 RepID=UPI0019FA880F|nr:hypothetical protein [Marinospirillum sp.]MBE0508506.1 hypothetical protein [Marinospirillum sp.]
MQIEWDHIWDRLPLQVREAMECIDSNESYTPLMAAAALGDSETLKWLINETGRKQLDRGFEAFDYTGNLVKTGYALTEALLNKQLECAALLVAAGCDIDVLCSVRFSIDDRDWIGALDLDYHSALELSYNINQSFFKTLLERAEDPVMLAADNSTLISRSILRHDHDFIQHLAERWPQHRFLTPHPNADEWIPAGHYAALRVIFTKGKAQELALDTLRCISHTVGFCLSWPGSSHSADEESLLELIYEIGDPDLLKATQLDRYMPKKQTELRDQANKIKLNTLNLIEKAYSFIDLFNEVAAEIDPYLIVENNLISMVYHDTNALSTKSWAIDYLNYIWNNKNLEREKSADIIDKADTLCRYIDTIKTEIEKWLISDIDNEQAALRWLEKHLDGFADLSRIEPRRFDFTPEYSWVEEVTALTFGFRWLNHLRELENKQVFNERII